MSDTGRRRLLYLLFLLYAVSLLASGGRALILGDARRQLREVQARAGAAEAALTRAEEALGEARRVHLRTYLGSVSFDAERRALGEARGLLERARRLRHPDRQAALIRQAAHGVSGIEAPVVERTGYMQLLDTALARYQTEPGRLAAATRGVRAYVAGLQREGYFPHHFARGEALLRSADGLHEQAVRAARRPFEGERPDYLRVYRTCLEGEGLARQARAGAEAVPALRRANAERIAALEQALRAARAAYGEARAAAFRLESYPPYRCIGPVESAYSELSGLDAAIRGAEARNGMAVQQFEACARELSRIEAPVGRAREQFRRTVSAWAQVAAAQVALAGARSSAASAIRSAESRISSYSRNSQSRAKGLVSSAESELSRGDALRATDPPRSLQAYQAARSRADEAYSAVDTSSDDDDDSGSSFSSGGSRSGGSSGPSGGGFGGPSGGGFGGGGF